MPFSNVLKSTSVVLFGALIGYTSVKYFSRPNENNRSLASMTFSKLGSEQFAQSLFDIKITNETLATKNEDVSEVLVTIEAYKTFPAGLVYSWNLPDTAIVIEGDLSGELKDVSAHEKRKYRIKLKGYSREVRSFVSFTVKGDLNEKSLARDVLVSSRPEDSFEYVVQEKEKERANELKINKFSKPTVKSPIDLDKVSF